MCMLVSVFDEDMQPFVRQALTGKGCGDVFGFLDNPPCGQNAKRRRSSSCSWIACLWALDLIFISWV